MNATARHARDAPGRRRVLMFAEAVTLAHVARPHVLAASLDPGRYEVCLAKDARFDALLGKQPYASRTIASIPSRQFLQALARGSPVYDAATLERYVREDLEVITRFDPDLVVGDFRLSLSVSCRLAGKPYLALGNAYWSPHAQPRYLVPDLPVLKWLPEPAGQLLFDLVRPLAFAHHCRPLNRVRRRHGLPGLGHDLRRIYTDADHVLYADLPELVPTHGLPPTHHYLGPILWEPQIALPDWWDGVPTKEPVVFVSLGSSGPVEFLPRLLDALSAVPVTLLVATAGRCRLGSPGHARIFQADFLPAAQAIARSRLVICNGGSPMSYLALAGGCPVLGIPGNLDQLLNMHYLRTYGAGEIARPGRTPARRLRGLVADMLEAASPWAEAARRLQDLVQRRRAGEQFAALLNALLT